MLESLINYKNLGGGTIVEVSTVGLQRDPEICAKLSEESGINVIMGKFKNPVVSNSKKSKKTF